MADGERHLATRYMVDFECLGAACEDTCCVGLTVPVDERAHARIAAALGDGDEARGAMAAAFRPDPSERTHLLLAPREDRSCHFLGGGLCTLHARFGEDVLADACALYPRVVADLRGRFELAGDVSCPVVARRIVADERALDLVPVERSAIKRGFAGQHLAATYADPYGIAFDDLRGIAWNLLSLAEYPTSARLWFLAIFAGSTRPFVARGVAFDGDAFVEAAESLRVRENLDALASGLTTMPIDAPAAMATVLDLVGAKSHDLAPPAFRRVIAEVFDGKTPAEVDPLVLAQAHHARVAALPREVAAFVDGVVARYAKNVVFKDWYLAWPSFLDYVVRLLAATATLRVLLVGRKELAGAARERRDAIAAETLYAFSRAVERDERLLRDLIADLDDAKSMTPPHLAALAAI